MADWPEGVEYLDPNTDLIAHDGGGFFLKSYHPQHPGVSQTFLTRQEAVEAWMRREIKWRK